MEHPFTGKIKKMPVGFTFLAFHRMLFRGEIGALLGNGLLTACTCGLYGFYVAATYNKKSIIKLLEKGFKVKEVEKGTFEEASAKLGINLPRFEIQEPFQAQTQQFGQQPPQPQMQQFGQQSPQPQMQQFGQQPPQPQMQQFGQQPMPSQMNMAYMMGKSRTVYILLAIFLGEFGIHNFYAGYNNKAVWQLLITLLTGGAGSLISWLWALCDMFSVSKDADGIPFK